MGKAQEVQDRDLQRQDTASAKHAISLASGKRVQKLIRTSIGSPFPSVINCSCLSHGSHFDFELLSSTPPTHKSNNLFGSGRQFRIRRLQQVCSTLVPATLHQSRRMSCNSTATCWCTRLKVCRAFRLFTSLSRGESCSVWTQHHGRQSWKIWRRFGSSPLSLQIHFGRMMLFSTNCKWLASRTSETPWQKQSSLFLSYAFFRPRFFFACSDEVLQWETRNSLTFCFLVTL